MLGFLIEGRSRNVWFLDSPLLSTIIETLNFNKGETKNQEPRFSGTLVFGSWFLVPPY